MSSFGEKYGPWALVTGASAGIGAEFARQLAARGLNVVLVARRRERLEALAEELQARHRVEARAAAMDLARPDFLGDVQAATAGLEIGLLVNNAGFGWSGAFLDHDLERELEMLAVNCRAALVLAHTFGRPMRDRRRGGIIFVSSVLGYMATPYLAHYAATKAYDLSLGEGLWFELRPQGVDVVTLSPGTTKTEFAQVAGAPEIGGMAVEPVVAAALKNLGRRPSVVAGWRNRALTSVQSQMPRRWRVALVGRVMRAIGRSQKTPL